MANLRLTALAKQFEDKTPTNVNELSNLTSNVETLYSDVAFDIVNLNDEKAGIYTDGAINSKVSKLDIEKIINEEAVLNSVKNWFHTNTYSHLLNPELSFNLYKYLFEPLNEYTAYFLALDITTTLPYYEPRIEITDCTISIDYDNDAYNISLKMIIPSLNNKEISFKDILSESGYTTI